MGRSTDEELVELANEDIWTTLSPYCSGPSADIHTSQQATFFALRGAEYFEAVLSIEKTDRLHYLRESLERKRAFLPGALAFFHRWRLSPETSYEDFGNVLTEPTEDEFTNEEYPIPNDNPRLPNLGFLDSGNSGFDFPKFDMADWFSSPSRQSYEVEDAYMRYDPLRGLGFVFWGARRFLSYPLKEGISEPRDESTYWPQSESRVDERLQNVVITKDDMAFVIEKYQPIDTMTWGPRRHLI